MVKWRRSSRSVIRILQPVMSYIGAPTRRARFALLAVVVAAAIIRLVDLRTVSPQFADEVFAAVTAHDIMTRGTQFNGAAVGPLGWISFLLSGAEFAYWLGNGSVFALRVVSAAFGLITVVLVYFVGREIKGRVFGLWSALALATMPWAIYYSRIAFSTGEVLCLEMLAVYLAVSGLRLAAPWRVCLSIVIASSCMYLYTAALVSVPVTIVMAVLATRWRELVRTRFGVWVLYCAVGVGALLPYVVLHLYHPSVGAQTTTSVAISGLLGTGGGSVASAAHQAVINWLWYLTPNYILFHGDPNVRQSIQAIGEVGWVAGVCGVGGILVGLTRRSSGDRLLLAWLVTYPLVDAVTSVDAHGNSVRAIFGAVVWAFLAGALVDYGIVKHRAWRHAPDRSPHRWKSPPAWAAFSVVVGALFVLQTGWFMSMYLGSYNATYGYAFNATLGYRAIVSDIYKAHLQGIPITMQAGYGSEAMLEYYSDYKLPMPSTILSCQPLGFNVVHYTVALAVMILRYSPGYAAYPYCVKSGLLQSDMGLLERARLSGGRRWKVEVVGRVGGSKANPDATLILLLSWIKPKASVRLTG